MLSSQHHIPIKQCSYTKPMQLLYVVSRSFSHRTHPENPTHPNHPFNGAVKNKACIYLFAMCLPCACGRFILFIHLFRYIPFHYIPLHPFIAFISPTSAPHSKSISFPSFHKPAHRLFVSWHPDSQHT